MDDDDEYEFDDTPLDEEALAILDKAEKDYLEETRKHSLSNAIAASRVEPATKRQKTNNGWTPGIGAASSSRATEDDLPEISVHGDGSYAIGRRPPVAQPAVQQRASHYTTPVPPAQVSSNQAPRPAPVRTTSYSTSHSAHATTGRQHTPRVQPQQVVRAAQPSAPNAAQIALQQKVEELQKKLDELSRNYAQVEASLKQESELRLIKEGEVSVLRNTTRSMIQAHEDKLAQVKLEKDEAIAKQDQMKKDMKEELERMRTQFLFRQQELEVANRKPPGSVKPKKLLREFPSPLPMPKAMAGWNANTATTSKARVEETPLRPSKLRHDSRASPTKPSRKSPEKPKKSLMLPGFENAFETSTPVRSPSKRLDKGKGRMVAEPESSTQQPQLSRPFSQISQGHTQLKNESAFATQMRLDSSSQGIPLEDMQMQSVDEDVDMTPLASEEDPFEVEPEPFDPIDWKSELCRILLTHVHPSEGRIALQHLISSGPNNGQDDVYSTSCMHIMEVIANPMKGDDYEESARIVAESLVMMLSELSGSPQPQALAVLFNLMSTLVISLPDFSSVLMLCRVKSRGQLDVSLMDLMIKVIGVHWETEAASGETREFPEQVTFLIQTLCFFVREDSSNEFERFIRDHRTLLILLKADQPPEVLELSTSLLMLLSSHHNTYKAFLKLSQDESQPSEPPRFLLMERLCALLLDTSRSPAEVTKSHILMYFSQLSIANPDAHAALGASPVLIPSLVMYISYLATPLFEDDGTLSSDLTDSYIHVLGQALYLLHHILLGAEPVINIRSKLYHASARQFNSIKHVFIVAFTRLSYCESPSWLKTEQQAQLEVLTGPALAVLGLMVDEGPVDDSLWEVFHAKAQIADDPEEMEAEFAGK